MNKIFPVIMYAAYISIICIAAESVLDVIEKKKRLTLLVSVLAILLIGFGFQGNEKMRIGGYSVNIPVLFILTMTLIIKEMKYLTKEIIASMVIVLCTTGYIQYFFYGNFADVMLTFLLYGVYIVFNEVLFRVINRFLSEQSAQNKIILSILVNSICYSIMVYYSVVPVGEWVNQNNKFLRIALVIEFIVSFLIRLRNNAKNLEYSSLHDQLTNCKNRKALDRFYSKTYDTGMSLAVIMCDLNGLKEVNDKQGHDAGDQFILRTAEILKSVFGDEKVYRMGGDEFIAVLTNISKNDLEEKIELAEIQLGSTASIGIAYKETMDTDFDSVLKIADAEMYKQKNQYYVATGKSRRK